MDVVFTAKQMFFDRSKVEKAELRARKKVLSKFGAFVRTRARSSMRPGGKKHKSAAAGEPPRTHVGLLKKLLYFGWDESSETVVVGPVPFKTGKVPRLMEQGGTATIERVKFRKGRPPQRVKVQANFAPHPFMAPALEREAPKFPSLYDNAVT